MSTAIQRRRGTTAQHSSFAGLAGELTVDTDKKTVVVHDGTTAGGMPLLPKTMSDGTANGVLYLNGSKVATSGSALVFDGTNLGVGTNSPLGKLDARGDLYVGANARILITEGGTGDAVIGGRAGTAFLALTVNGSEQARLTSTGLGIGTSSPSTKLHVAGTVVSNQGVMKVQDLGGSGTSAYPVIALYDAGGTHQGDLGMFAGDQVIANLTASGKILFKTNSTTVGTLDSSGNLGLGVTPSAWNNSIKALQVNNAALASFTNGGNVQTWLANNAYYDNATGWLYKNSSVGAALYAQSFNGSHNWNIAPSGTAGNAITFTQAMTLDASGNLGVANTSPSSYNGVADNLVIGTSGSTGLTIVSGTSNDGSIHFADGTSGADAYRGQIYYNHAANYMVFGTDGTERARIDSSGNLLVGTTSLTGPIVSGGSGVVLRAAGQIYANDTYLNVNADGTIMQFRRSGTAVGSISVTTTATAYNTSSDQRLKENIVNAPEFGNVLDAIQVRSFDWKTDQTHQRAGFIAQELVSVAPEAVYQPADPEEMMAVDYSKLVPMLVKEIQSLRARVAQLESN